MSSSAPRGGERMIHQDFIARIRYSNALPPPPNPPKLLDVPNTGLASGRYTNPSFASRLAREQPLNIEADAELGMPLDLVGMPGIFDGDESSIQASTANPHIHPHDRPLLRPLSTLGRPKGTDTSVSFLRRTEYISSNASKRLAAGGSQANAFLKPKIKRPEKRAAPEPEAGSPVAIRRKIDRSFEAAERYLKDNRSVPHPSKKQGLHVVDSRPLLPDLDAFPDAGAYVTVKLATNPVPSTDRYDRRLLSAIMRPMVKSPEEEEALQAALEAHQRDPETYPKPSNLLDYQFFLPASAHVGDQFRKSFDLDDGGRDAPELYTHESKDMGPCFQFHRLRSYETTKETEFDASEKYSDELILAFNDAEGLFGDEGEDGEGNAVMRQKAAYFYPVMQRSTIRPQRAKNILRNTMSQNPDGEEEQVVNQLDISLSDPSADLRALAAKYKADPYLGHAEATEDPEADAEAEARAQVESEAAEARNGADRSRGDSDDEERETSRRRTPLSDDDADGDAEGEDD